MPAEPFRLQQPVGFRYAIHGGKAKTPPSGRGGGPETRSHSGRGDAVVAGSKFRPRVTEFHNRYRKDAGAGKTLSRLCRTTA
jgi:hypothetical protein